MMQMRRMMAARERHSHGQEFMRDATNGDSNDGSAHGAASEETTMARLRPKQWRKRATLKQERETAGTMPAAANDGATESGARAVRWCCSDVASRAAAQQVAAAAAAVNDVEQAWRGSALRHNRSPGMFTLLFISSVFVFILFSRVSVYGRRDAVFGSLVDDPIVATVLVIP
ncbi:hypothetical protein Scep_009407 [Stephania cephalantha]|uniref:Uncharacterized protein n=1 Tax=Stephania cephalantha TaxID=152367 RepID=A0AAP0JTN4_9MAGN